MNTGDFIAACLGCGTWDCEKIDNLCDDFDVDLWEDDVKDMIQCGGGVNYLISTIFYRIIDEMCENYGAEEDDFDYYLNSIDSHLYFLGDEVFDKDELIEKIEQKNLEAA